jgi:hypothetical protein
VATATAAIFVLTPSTFFIISEGQNLTYSLSPSLLKLLGKITKSKTVARVNVKKIKAKKYKKRYRRYAMKEVCFRSA